jgi:hypothetical protein
VFLNVDVKVCLREVHELVLNKVNVKTRTVPPPLPPPPKKTNAKSCKKKPEYFSLLSHQANNAANYPVNEEK